MFFMKALKKQRRFTQFSLAKVCQLVFIILKFMDQLEEKLYIVIEKA